MVTYRGTYVRNTGSVRIRNTPKLPVTIGRGANLICFIAKTICKWTTTGDNLS